MDFRVELVLWNQCTTYRLTIWACCFDAAQNNQLRLLKYLRSIGWLTPEIISRGDGDIFNVTAVRGHVEVLVYFVEKVDYDPREWEVDHGCVLGMIAENGHVDVVRFMFDSGIVDAMDVQRDQYYALRYAAKNDHVDVVRFLVDVLETEDEPFDALYQWAVLHESHNVVSFLDERSAQARRSAAQAR
jgi:hypothetical protein